MSHSKIDDRVSAVELNRTFPVQFPESAQWADGRSLCKARYDCAYHFIGGRVGRSFKCIDAYPRGPFYQVEWNSNFDSIQQIDKRIVGFVAVDRAVRLSHVTQSPCQTGEPVKEARAQCLARQDVQASFEYAFCSDI
jgi:hypothetical protein